MKHLYTILLIALTSLSAFAQCPTNVTVNTQSGCGLYQLHLNEFGEAGNIIWTYDGGQPLQTGQNNVFWGTLIPGLHEVCAQAWTATCPNGVTICTIIEVPICPGTNCPTELNISQIGCGTYTLAVAGFDTGTVQWQFGDGTEQNGGTSADHHYTSNGTYTITALYNGPTCPNISFVYATVNVDCFTTENCPEGITSSAGVSCGAMDFEIGSFVEGEEVTWFTGDGSEPIVGGHFLEHVYAQSGNYSVCAFYTSSLCPEGIELCTEITVAPCNTICPDHIEMQTIDCDSYIFHIAGVNVGEVVWDYGDGTSANEGITSDHTYAENGLYIVSAQYFSAACPNGANLIYTIEVNCINMPPCPEGIFSAPGEECGLMNFEIGGFVPGESVTWFPGDGSPSEVTPHFYFHHYAEPGIYNVCAFYTSPNCPEGVQLCIEITVAPCTTNDCPAEINMQQVDCDTYVFNVNSGTNAQVIWDFGDNNFGAGSVADHTFSTNGLFIVTAQYFSANCPNGVTLIYTVLVNCETGDICPDHISSFDGLLCGTINFEIGSFVEGEAVTWNPGDGSGQVFGGHFLSHHYDQPGVYTVCAFYSSPVCPEGVELCTTVTIPNCNGPECPTAITAQQIGCASYVFQVTDNINSQVIWNFGDNTSGSTGFIADHSYNSNGLYIVTAQYFSSACPNGVTLVYTVEVNCTTGANCPDHIANSAGNDCGVMNFEIGSFVEGESVIWYPGDESGQVQGGHFFTHTYASPGEYSVCAFYTSPNCPNGVELCTTILVAPCNIENCPTTITITPVNCHQYLFSVNEWGPSLYGNILWNFGDNEGYGQNQFLHLYVNGGEYNVCATGTTDACPSGFNICTTLHVGACGGDSNNDGCPDYIWGHPMNDCGSWHFEAGLSESENQSATWEWGDGTTSSGSTIMNHQYETAGLYIVSLTYQSADCAEPITLLYTLQTNVCATPDCPQEIAVIPTSECGVFHFEAGGFVEGENFNWMFGDNTSQLGGHFITHHFTSPGTYNVCLVMSNSICQGWQLCTTVLVEPCEIPCSNVVMGIDSYVANGGTTELYYTIIDVDTNEFIEFGQATYTTEDPFFDTSICLEDGCYQLLIDNNTPLTVNGNIFISLMMNGVDLMDNAEILMEGDVVVSIRFGVNTNCFAVPECAALFEAITTNTPGHIEFNNTSTFTGPTTFHWSYGDGQTSTGQSGNVFYTENGLHNVCLTITTENCSHIYCQNVLIQNIEVLCEHNLVTLNVEADYPVNIQELVTLALSFENVNVNSWTLPMTNNFTNTVTVCIPDGCYTLDLSTPLPTAANSIYATVTFNNETINVLQFLENHTSASVTFGIHSDCVDGVSEHAADTWNIFPNPTQSMLNIVSTDKSDIEQIDLINAMGQIVESIRPSHTNKYQLNVATYASGHYGIRITSKNTATFKRFEVVH